MFISINPRELAVRNWNKKQNNSIDVHIPHNPALQLPGPWFFVTLNKQYLVRKDVVIIGIVKQDMQMYTVLTMRLWRVIWRKQWQLSRIQGLNFCNVHTKVLRRWRFASLESVPKNSTNAGSPAPTWVSKFEGVSSKTSLALRRKTWTIPKWWRYLVTENKKPRMNNIAAFENLVTGTVSRTTLARLVRVSETLDPPCFPF